MSICHALNNRMCSPKASRKTIVLILPPPAVLEGNGRPVSFSGACCMCRGPVDPRRLNPAHPADVMIFTSLASFHQAQLRSPRLNELSSPAAAGRLRGMQPLVVVQTIISSDKEQNISQYKFVFYPLKKKCIICAHPPELDCYHNNVRLRHFHDCGSAEQRAEVKLKHYRKEACVPFKIQAPV